MKNITDTDLTAMLYYLKEYRDLIVEDADYYIEEINGDLSADYLKLKDIEQLITGVQASVLLQYGNTAQTNKNKQK